MPTGDLLRYTRALMRDRFKTGSGAVLSIGNNGASVFQPGQGRASVFCWSRLAFKSWISWREAGRANAAVVLDAKKRSARSVWCAEFGPRRELVWFDALLGADTS